MQTLYMYGMCSDISISYLYLADSSFCPCKILDDDSKSVRTNVLYCVIFISKCC